MEIIFYNDEVWDIYTGQGNPRQTQEPIPLYAICYKESNNTWWMWYHSWNNITNKVSTGVIELFPICKAYLLLLPQGEASCTS